MKFLNDKNTSTKIMTSYEKIMISYKKIMTSYTESHNFITGRHNIAKEYYNFFKKEKYIFAVQNFKQIIEIADIKYTLESDDYMA